MTKCPRCGTELLRGVDGEFDVGICLICSYYESNSPTYKRTPEPYADTAGKYYLARRNGRLSKLSKEGLTKKEAEAWLDQEPDYRKNMLKPSDGFIHRRRSAGDYTVPAARFCQVFVG